MRPFVPERGPRPAATREVTALSSGGRRSLATAMGWEPTAKEVEEKLIQLAYAWGDIEERLIVWAALDTRVGRLHVTCAKAALGDGRAGFSSRGGLHRE